MKSGSPSDRPASPDRGADGDRVTRPHRAAFARRSPTRRVWSSPRWRNGRNGWPRTTATSRRRSRSTDLLADAGSAEGADDGPGDGSSDDLPVVTRFLLGRVFPAHDTRTLDVGPALCREAIARAAGPNVSAGDVEDRLAERGEIGAVAADYDFGGQRGLAAFGGGRDALTVAAVDERLRELAAESGEGSESRKRDALFGLFTRCSPSEAAFLARLVLGEMRLGVGEGTVRDAIAEAFLAPDPEPDERRRATATTTADGDDAAGGDDAADASDRPRAPRERRGGRGRRTRPPGDQRLRPGRGPRPRRGDRGAARESRCASAGRYRRCSRRRARRPTRSTRSARSPSRRSSTARAFRSTTRPADAGVRETRATPTDRTTRAALGPRLYSRNMDDVTEALPEIVEYVAERVDVPAILDGEVVAVDDAGDPLPFQEVLRRFRRKHDVDRMRDDRLAAAPRLRLPPRRTATTCSTNRSASATSGFGRSSATRPRTSRSPTTRTRSRPRSGPPSTRATRASC
ncbi:MAG: hypothetical protein U5J95_03235 [Balneolaceae bacterium]|nr:hypothetical protein [Balneolaceae bacterium]